MKICYIVYREDNVMVFDSQVLEYLKKLREHSDVEEVSLVLFRHEDNLFKRKEVEYKIRKFVDSYVSFPSLPVLTMAQLNLNSKKLYNYIKQYYSPSDRIGVVCRGDLATYVGIRAFKNIDNSRILYDCRGLAYEESLMCYGDKWIHKKNRDIKLKTLKYAKDNCDLYNFVTNPMRNYMLEKHGFKSEIPYTIIPTLYKEEGINPSLFAKIRQEENVSKSDYIVTYVGSTAAWQSTSQLVDIIEKVSKLSENTRFMILTNGSIPEMDRLKGKYQQRITYKSVKHSHIEYYLAMSNLGIVIRDDNIVNHVAAPTKIAEYLTNGLKILYSGNIGIITDLKSVLNESVLIEYGDDKNWLSKIDNDIKQPEKNLSRGVVSYFDMYTRQEETLQILKTALDKERG